MNITQRQLSLLIMGGMSVYTFARALIGLIAGEPLVAVGLTLSVTLIFGVTAWLYWRGWEVARIIAAVGLALLIAALLPLDKQMIVLFTPLSFALALTSVRWLAGIGVGTMIILLGRDLFDNNLLDSVYVDPAILASYAVQITVLAATRLALDSARVEAERNAAQAESARAEAESRAQDIERQRAELQEQNQRQQELIALIGQLEIPAVRIASGVVLAPLIGSIDSQRAERITSRLLTTVHEQRVNLVIIDIAGVPTVDTIVASALTQTVRALQLLGCEVILTGISPQVAMTLTDAGVDLRTLEVAASPQEALQQRLDSGRRKAAS
ncbi:STAS domain-containing protein [Roseiflexus sp.]|uniref:STAS domain-containing protein n=1 Tax=Roseiflexus sp. TaxID=2562120 RepID=UPI00398B4FBF